MKFFFHSMAIILQLILPALFIVSFQNCSLGGFQVSSFESSSTLVIPNATTCTGNRPSEVENVDCQAPYAAEKKAIQKYNVVCDDKGVWQKEPTGLIDYLACPQSCSLGSRPTDTENVSCPAPNSNLNQGIKNFNVTCNSGGQWVRMLASSNFENCPKICDSNLKPLDHEAAQCPNSSEKLAVQNYSVTCSANGIWLRSPSGFNSAQCPSVPSTPTPVVNPTVTPNPAPAPSVTPNPDPYAPCPTCMITLIPVLDLKYPTATGEQLFDMYLPADYLNRKYPIMIWIHGGGWGGGDKSMDTNIARSIASNGYIVMNLNYTLVSLNVLETKFPAGVNDINDFYKYLKNNLGVLNADLSTPIGVSGSSAGGHMALFQAVRSDSPINFKCVIDVAGPSDLTLGADHWVLISQVGTINVYLNASNTTEATYAQKLEASPYSRISALRSKNILLMHAYNDNVVPIEQAMRVERALKARGDTNVQTIYLNQGVAPIYELAQASHYISIEQITQPLNSYLMGRNCR